MDNGRSTEFIRRRDYPDKSRCYECGEEGHLSYQCIDNTLGPRTPPPKKVRKRNSKSSRSLEPVDTSFYDGDSDEEVRDRTGVIEEETGKEEVSDEETWGSCIRYSYEVINLIDKKNRFLLYDFNCLFSFINKNLLILARKARAGKTRRKYGK